jgi:hypothetical protein
MSVPKIVLLVVYAVLAGLALTQGDSAIGIWSLRILILFAVVHAIETAVYFKLCAQAPGSLIGHLINVFLFGVLHVNQLKAAQGNS